MRGDENISHKTNRVLNLFLLALILIFIRVWFLAVIQREDQLELSQKPRRRSSIEKIERGTIRDRYNIPLAENKIQYVVAISYADIKEIPAFEWNVQSDGKKVKIAKRKEYIAKLSEILASELNINPQTIEDTIYGKAALFPQLPFVIKEDLSEKEYFRLKGLEKDFLGIRTQKNYKRIYPLEKIGCEVIGYMGSISDSEYKNITKQISALERYIQQRENGETPLLPKGFTDPSSVRSHLKDLKEKAYSLQDFIGKSGIESQFDKELRGSYGKNFFEIDTKGNTLRKLPGTKAPSPPRRVILTLSAELQEFSEALLAQRERKKDSSFQQKGGAIVAMDPNTGEVLSLASYPRFSPQDFIPSLNPSERQIKNQAVSKWLETESYLGQIWDGEKSLEKELYDTKQGFYTVYKPLNWQSYLESILSQKSAAFKAMSRLKTIKDAWILQDTFKKLHALLGYKPPKEVLKTLRSMDAQTLSEEISLEEWRALKELLNFYLSQIPNETDQLLCIDIARLLVSEKNFNEERIDLFQDISLSDYNLHRQLFVNLEKDLNQQIREIFLKTSFAKWRSEHFKEFLAQKRKKEIEKGTYARPYTDYLEAEEKKQFAEFWITHKEQLLGAFLFGESPLEKGLENYISFLKTLKENGWQEKIHHHLEEFLFGYSNEEKQEYLKSMRSFENLKSPLLGKYKRLREQNGQQLEKHLAEAFYPLSGHGYVRSSAFRQAIPQGSVFKLVVGYAALKERYLQLKDSLQSSFSLNPLTLIDDLKWGNAGRANQILGFTLEGEAITRAYKGGKLPRSSHTNIGRIDLIGALEQSSNIYFSLLASEHIESPSSLLKTSRNLGYGTKTCIDLPGEFSGKLPEDITYDKTGLYAFAIGQHSLIVTPLQTAVMLSSIANGGKVLKPQIVKIIAAKEKKAEMTPFDYDQNFAYEEPLDLIGIHFPLFTEALPLSSQNVFKENNVKIKEEILLPEEIRDYLLKGMQQAVIGARGTARPSVVRPVCSSEKVYQDYLSLKDQMIGKTGTAELMIKPTLDTESRAEIQNHVWFAAISFESSSGKKEKWDDPELVVVVYLPNGTSGGREAAPLAAQVIKKWREIKTKYQNF